MALRVLRDEFRWKNFGYNHPDPSAFWRYQWICWDLEHLSLRLLLAGYVLYAYIHELVHYYMVAVNHGVIDSSTIDTNTTIAPGSNITSNSSSSGVASGHETPTLSTTTEYSTGIVEDPGWDTRRPWFVFLTLWSFTVLMLHLVLAAVLAVVFTYRKKTENSSRELEPPHSTANLVKGDGADTETKTSSFNMEAKISSDDAPPLAWYFKLSWLLADIITPIAPIVTLVFFAALYGGGPLDIFNANVHVMNTVLVFMDQVISARPIRLLHVVAPIVFGLIYNLFNFIFWTFDHKEHLIYPGVIDWGAPGKTILNVFVIAFVLIPAFMFLWFLFYRLKLRIYAWRYGTRK